jgi:putative ATP-dependent endonuclease of OLD family
MSIQIDTVRIAGFRGLANIEISLPLITVLIGCNNSGKTSVIKALQLAMGDYSRYLQNEDFNITSEDKIVDRILIDIRIVAVDTNGIRIKIFEDDWIEEFGDTIQSEPDGHQFFAMRTECQPDYINGGFSVARFSLNKWEDFTKWQDVVPQKRKKISKRFESLPFISIDAQRDIHRELKERSSYIGKVLASVKYEDDDVKKLEEMISEINNEALASSDSLLKLKENLDSLNESFQGSGRAEITPFPKKIRDLSQRYTVHFGKSETDSFSMEYHGMGTRSWASMLTVRALTEIMAKKHKSEIEPFFPIIAAEEPEAHLHPNAQRTLYQQLKAINGQVIISTHSPYLAALANQNELRGLSSCSSTVSVHSFNDKMEFGDRLKLQREVIDSRGELLFSQILVLSEGETEEQALPLLFTKYFDQEPFALGINFIGVGGSGAKYRPFLHFAKDFDIPVFIFSDGEERTVKQLQKHYSDVYGDVDVTSANNITILDNTDFEGDLINSGFCNIIEKAIEFIQGEEFINSWISKRDGTHCSPQKSDQPPCPTCYQPIYESPKRDYSGLSGRKRAIHDILDSKKPLYAQAITEEICKLDKGEFPKKIIEFFEKIKKAMTL